MEVIKVENSSQIEAIGYERGVMLVKFKSGGLYSYSGVTIEEFEGMKAAESKGHYLNESIKKTHAYTNLTELVRKDQVK